MDYILETQNLTKCFGKHEAVKNVNIHIQKGDIYGLIGKNGAGKTTIMRMLSGLENPSSGSFSFCGYTGNQISKVKNKIGILIEEPGLFPDMNAADNLKYFLTMVGKYKKSQVDNLLNLAGLSTAGNAKVKYFSLGMKQRLGIAVALTGDPELLMLDEPINGLDPQGIVQFRDTIMRLNKEKNITILISSHILEELSKITNYYGIIHNGQILTELSKNELMKKCNECIEIRTDDTYKAIKILKSNGISTYKIIDQKIINVFGMSDKSGEINTSLVKNGITVNEICIRNESLENFYLNLTGGTQNV